MSVQGKLSADSRGDESVHGDEWVCIPAIVDANGDKVVTLRDERGQAQTRLVAELILEAFVGPPPVGHVIGFKDGDHLNCQQANLEWVMAPATRNEAAREKAIATRKRADAMRKTLESRPHSDSGLLVAEDRLR